MLLRGQNHEEIHMSKNFCSKLIHIHYPLLAFRLLTCVLGQNEDKDQHLSNYPEQQPLEISDIMPLAKKSYDKMRPPKFKSKDI